VAVLRIHAAVYWLRNDRTILAEPGERITQLQYLLQLFSNCAEIPEDELLRACLVKVRVRMVSYAISYEKVLSDRPLRCPVDPFAILPTHPKGPGKTTHPLLARCS
jgi:hypothetical protein